MSESLSVKKLVGAKAGESSTLSIQPQEVIFKDTRTGKEIQKVEVWTEKDQGREHGLTMIRKRFSDAFGWGAMTAAYKHCYDAHLKVPGTFRVNRTEHTVLMTYLNSESRVVTSGNNTSSELPSIPTIAKISDLETFVAKFFSDAIRAAAVKVRLPLDSYFFAFNPTQNTTELDYLIGDFEMVFIYDYRYSANTYPVPAPENLVFNNLQDARDALLMFLAKHVSSPREMTRVKRVIATQYTASRKPLRAQKAQNQ